MEDVNKLKKDISELKKKLEDANSKKEEWFEKKESLKKDLADLINKSKELKSETSQDSIKEFKTKRDQCNKNVKDLISRLRELRKETRSLPGLFGLKKNPQKLKEEIEKLETSIETNVIPFSKEQKIMKKINDLRNKYKETSNLDKKDDEIKNLVKELEASKKEADGFHEQLKKAVGTSKENYNEFMKISRKINEIKTEQEQAFENFIKYKQEFFVINNELKKRLSFVKEKRI